MFDGVPLVGKDGLSRSFGAPRGDGVFGGVTSRWCCDGVGVVCSSPYHRSGGDAGFWDGNPLGWRLRDYRRHRHQTRTRWYPLSGSGSIGGDGVWYQPPRSPAECGSVPAGHQSHLGQQGVPVARRDNRNPPSALFDPRVIPQKGWSGSVP